jgi:O-Antigen ligase
VAGFEQGQASRPAAGIFDLYRSTAGAASDLGQRYRAGLAGAVALIVTYAFLRTIDADRILLLAWAAVMVAVAVISPANGLIVLAAIAPFSEPLSFTRQLGLKPIVVGALIAGVGVRVAADIVRTRRIGVPPIPILLAMLLGLGTLGSVLVAAINFGWPFAANAIQLWLAGIGGGLAILLVAYWVARTGDRRAFFVAVASATIGGIISLADFIWPGSFRGAVVDWLVRPNSFGYRLSGIIPQPNGSAALIIVPAAVLAAAAVLRPGRASRILAASMASLLIVALYFSYSRAALLGLFASAVIIVWRIRRAAGALLLAVGVVGGAIALPFYLQYRSQYVIEGQVVPGAVLVASDLQRLDAWRAASAMWLDSPLFGHGFQSYRELHGAYGDIVLSAPHNEWIRLFAEGGIVVGLVGIAWAATTFLTLARAPSWFGAGSFATFTGWALAATFNNPTGYIQVGIIAFTVVGTGLAVAATKRVASSDEESTAE